MSLISRIKSVLQGGKLDVESRFEKLREITTGSMSEFRIVRERSSGRILGLKILDREKTATFEQRFKGLKKPGEGEIAFSLKHPRIVETFAYGLTTDSQQYLLMEYLDGYGLNTLIARRSELLEGRRLPFIRQMAEAIEAVHEAGYIHRDISPRNFICREDLASLKLIDFGVTVPATKEFMQPGNRTGNPLYMAPEIVRRRATDHRVDVFAFGVSCYQLCAFELPWPSQDASGTVAMQHDTLAPVDLRTYAPWLHPVLARSIMRCISADPDARPESMKQFLHETRKLDSERA